MPRIARTLLCLSVVTLATWPSAACRTGDPPAAAIDTRPGGRAAIGPIPGVAAPAAAPRENPYADDDEAATEGRRLFVSMNCSGCHGGHAGGGMGPSLRDPVWVYGGEHADVFDSIADGRAYGMPAWGTLLPADTIWKITAYVKLLETASEPMPPQ